ncbi:MAG: endonuclease [Clostridium sp.]|nr:endonuclease [Clostridium sp.]
MKHIYQKSILAIAAIVLAVSQSFAEIPAGYYNSINGKTDAQLKTAVYQVIHNLTRISSYSDLPKYFQKTDVYPESNRWWDMYSDIPLYAPSFSGLNREHSFPKSWWGGLTNVNAYVDLNHLYPSEMKANTAKSNYPLGEVDPNYKADFDNGVCKVGYAVTGQGGGAKFVFEPADEYKGDFARTYFYMVTCYQDYTWEQKYMYMLQQNTYPTLSGWALDLLLKWSREDPVSQKEIDRNEQVYKAQNNRNPFIDFPSLAEYIWGTHKGEPFDIKQAGGGTVEPAGDPVLITPVQDMSLDFGQVALGKTTTAKMFFKGENLTGNISLRIYSGNKDYFTVPSNKIAANLVNAADGYWLNITYAPTALGEHASRLLISDYDGSKSRGVALIGECLPVPTLSACTALPAADITSDSYLASWTCPDDVVDYYEVTRTMYSGGGSKEEKLVAEGTELTITDFDENERESYYVRSVRLGYYSDPSNVVFVDHLGITGVAVEQPMYAIGQEGGIRIACSAPQTGCRVYDVAGRLVTVMDRVENNSEISLPQGVYIVVTDQCGTPSRVAVR